MATKRTRTITLVEGVLKRAASGHLPDSDDQAQLSRMLPTTQLALQVQGAAQVLVDKHEEDPAPNWPAANARASKLTELIAENLDRHEARHDQPGADEDTISSILRGGPGGGVRVDPRTIPEWRTR